MALIDFFRAVVILHRIAQCPLTRKVPVDTAVADAERTGDVDDGRLCRPEATEDVLDCCENAGGGKR
jgi:hypothetical protein